MDSYVTRDTAEGKMRWNRIMINDVVQQPGEGVCYVMVISPGHFVCNKSDATLELRAHEYACQMERLFFFTITYEVTYTQTDLNSPR